MLIRPMFLFLGCFLSCVSIAGTMGTPPPPPPVADDCPWTITASLGYAALSGAYEGQGESGVGRLAVGKTFRDYERSSLGWELGFQTGTTMQLYVPQDTLNVLGGLPITVTLKPFLDLLATWRFMPISTMTMFGEIKVGAAYRRMDILMRQTVNNKSQFASEVQAGLGIPITDVAILSLLYQGIYGSNVDFRANATMATGLISNIPIQNGIILSLNVAL